MEGVVHSPRTCFLNILSSITFLGQRSKPLKPGSPIAGTGKGRNLTLELILLSSDRQAPLRAPGTSVHRGRKNKVQDQITQSSIKKEPCMEEVEHIEYTEKSGGII